MVWVVATLILAPLVYLILARWWPADPRKASWLAGGIVFASTLHRAVTEPEATWTKWMIVVSIVLLVLFVGRFVRMRRA